MLVSGRSQNYNKYKASQPTSKTEITDEAKNLWNFRILKKKKKKPVHNIGDSKTQEEDAGSRSKSGNRQESKDFLRTFGQQKCSAT